MLEITINLRHLCVGWYIIFMKFIFKDNWVTFDKQRFTATASAYCDEYSAHGVSVTLEGGNNYGCA